MDFKSYLNRNSNRINKLVSDYFVQQSNPDLSRYLYQPLSAFSAGAGKRHRPLICELACQAVGGDPERAHSAASAIEHFHSAALIHDDIADESELRRGQPSLHRQIGVGLAINAGDLALSQVTGLLIEDKILDDATKLKVLDELVQMTTRTIEGQALDLGWAQDKRFDLSIADYMLMATLKTAHYSGGTPLAVGAIVGGGNEEQIEALRAFGIASGLAFQIQDDLLNLIGKKQATLKDYRNDITEGKRTLMVVHALQNSDEAAQLVEVLSTHTNDADTLEWAVQAMIKSGSLEFAHQQAIELVQQAKAELPRVLEPSKYRDLLLSMADFFIERMN
ncbi:MAG: polyprenyl synthetase family protein [Coriobacteriales bacterium]|jgi:geranylgeranyl diphosphate synthase type I|nr:polyprenyl synthetase family protein [Coriobacteriales bacterium]